MPLSLRGAIVSAKLVDTILDSGAAIATEFDVIK
jgi:hypothetical protein